MAESQIGITANNNETFYYVEDVTVFGSLYPLAQGVFRAQMKNIPPAGRAIASEPVLYEWSSDRAESGGSIFYSESQATGSHVFSAQPTAGQYIVIGTSIVTLVASGATGLQVDIGGALSATMTALLTFLQESTDPQLSQCAYSVVNSTLYETYNLGGMVGNNFPIGGNAATPSAATLLGGGHFVGFVAPESDMAAFLGSYIYDLRFEYHGNSFTLLSGGPITFAEGVTRMPSDATEKLYLFPAGTGIAMKATLGNALIFGW